MASRNSELERDIRGIIEVAEDAARAGRWQQAESLLGEARAAGWIGGGEEIKPPRRVEILRVGQGRGYFKPGQFGYARVRTVAGGFHALDLNGPSRPGQVVYAVSKSKDGRGGAVWFTEDALRFTGRGPAKPAKVSGTASRAFDPGDHVRVAPGGKWVKSGVVVAHPDLDPAWTRVKFAGRGGTWVVEDWRTSDLCHL